MNKKDFPILLVIDHFGSGGAQRQIVAIANGLVEKGYQVHIFIYYPQHDHHRSNLDKRVVVQEAQKQSRFGLNVLFALMKLIRENSYYSCMAFLSTPSFYLELACFITASKSRLYYSERSSLDVYGDGLWSHIRKKMHNRCSHITSNSIGQTEVLADYYGINKVSYIPNALPDHLFDTPLSFDKKFVGEYTVISHTAKYKNYRYIAESIVEYYKKYGTKPPVINWYGELYDLEEVNEIKELLSSNGLSGHLVFKGVTNDVGEVLKNTRFLLHPSLYESSANSIAEALSTGTPVILGNIADHTKIVELSNSGFVVDLNAPLELAELLFNCQNISFEIYTELCRNAKGYALAIHKADLVLEKYYKILCPNT